MIYSCGGGIPTLSLLACMQPRTLLVCRGERDARRMAGYCKYFKLVNR